MLERGAFVPRWANRFDRRSLPAGINPGPTAVKEIGALGHRNAKGMVVRARQKSNRPTGSVRCSLALADRSRRQGFWSGRKG